MIELQSRILGLKLAELKDFGINMKWLTTEIIQGKGKSN